MTLFDLSGKVAVVTGSSRGIGLAIASQLAAHGARVVVSSRKAEACAAAVDRITKTAGPGTAIAIPANISAKDDLQHLIAETERQLGTVDILVCNAASNPYYGPMSGISDDAFRKILENNVIANHWLTQLVVPGMKARRDGVILIVSSIGGMQGSPTIGAYNISKAADLQLARNLAVELGPDNIRVNCLCPGLVKTDFAKVFWDSPSHMSHLQAHTPLGRIGEPDEIAGAAVFLSSKAGRYITGQGIIIDGGMSVMMHLPG